MRSVKWLVVFVASWALHAQAAEQVPDVGNVGALDRAQAATLLGKARANAAQAEADAAKYSGMEGGLPSINSIIAVDTPHGSNTVVKLVYNNGAEIEVAAGDSIPGGYRVQQILVNQNQVELVKGREHLRIGFAGRTSATGR